jgi:hypothetical protein
MGRAIGQMIPGNSSTDSAAKRLAEYWLSENRRGRNQLN